MRLPVHRNWYPPQRGDIFTCTLQPFLLPVPLYTPNRIPVSGCCAKAHRPRRNRFQRWAWVSGEPGGSWARRGRRHSEQSRRGFQGDGCPWGRGGQLGGFFCGKTARLNSAVGLPSPCREHSLLPQWRLRPWPGLRSSMQLGSTPPFGRCDEDSRCMGIFRHVLHSVRSSAQNATCW